MMIASGSLSPSQMVIIGLHWSPGSVSQCVPAILLRDDMSMEKKRWDTGECADLDEVDPIMVALLERQPVKMGGAGSEDFDHFDRNGEVGGGFPTEVEPPST
jgi:hypothetical protein